VFNFSTFFLARHIKELRSFNAFSNRRTIGMYVRFVPIFPELESFCQELCDFLTDIRNSGNMEVKELIAIEPNREFWKIRERK